jgi:hypothetical protein
MKIAAHRLLGKNGDEPESIDLFAMIQRLHVVIGRTTVWSGRLRPLVNVRVRPIAYGRD